MCGLYGHIFQADNFSAAIQDHILIHSLLIDLSTLTQAVGLLYPQCTGESWKEEPKFTIARLSVQHLLTLQELTKKAQCHSLPVNTKLAFQNL